MHLPCNPAISLLKYIHFKDTLPQIQKDIYKRLFMETLFIMIEKAQNGLKCLSIRKWLNKCGIKK